MGGAVLQRDPDDGRDDLAGSVVLDDAGRPERADLDVEARRPEGRGGCGHVLAGLAFVEGFDRELNPLHGVRLRDGADGVRQEADDVGQPGPNPAIIGSSMASQAGRNGTVAISARSSSLVTKRTSATSPSANSNGPSETARNT